MKFTAVWDIDSPEILESEEYRAKGGSFPVRWQPHIANRTRTVTR